VSNNSGGFFDVAASREELKRIEASAFSPDFWNDPETAQALLQKRSVLEKKIRRQEQFEAEIEDAEVLLEFAEEDEGSLKELRSLIERLEHGLSQAEIEMLLAGDNDHLNAICTIHPGAGGTESQDRAEIVRLLGPTMQRYVVGNMVQMSATTLPFIQAARDYVKGYTFERGFKIRFETTWLDKQ